MDEEQILHWLVSQLEHDEIEDVTDEMLDKMVKEGRVLAVLFCNYRIMVIGEKGLLIVVFILQMTITTKNPKGFWKNWKILTMNATNWA